MGIGANPGETMAMSELLDSYLTYCRFRKEFRRSNKLDLSPVNFLHPSLLLPLRNLFDKAQYIDYVKPSNPGVAQYAGIMGLGELAGGHGSGHFPPIKLGADDQMIQFAIDKIMEILEQGKKCGGIGALSHVVNELTDNVANHAVAQHSYIMGQCYPKRGFTEICILDDGRTIAGSLEKSGWKYESDLHAMIGAIRGDTASNRTQGFGLGSSLHMLVEKMEGEALVVSRNAGLLINPETKDMFNLEPNGLGYEGTVISMRIPHQTEKIDDYWKHVQKRIEM